MFGSFLPSRLVGFSIHQLYSGIGADIVMESITPIDPDFGEQTTQAGENADFASWLRP